MSEPTKHQAVGITLACEHTVWFRPPLPKRGESLWCVKCQTDVPIGGRHTQKTYFEDWTLIPTRKGYQGLCRECDMTALDWNFYSLRTHMEMHFIQKHVTTGRLAAALRDVKHAPIPTTKDLDPPF